MVGKLRNIKQIRHQFAHHLTGIILTVIRERKLLIMVKKLLAHVPLHMSAHHMPLVTHIILTKTLHQIHSKEPQGNQRKRPENHCAVSGKQSVSRCPENLRVSQICQTDKGRAQKIKKKDRLVRAIIMNKLLYGLHHKPPVYFFRAAPERKPVIIFPSAFADDIRPLLPPRAAGHDNLNISRFALARRKKGRLPAGGGNLLLFTQ